MFIILLSSYLEVYNRYYKRKPIRNEKIIFNIYFCTVVEERKMISDNNHQFRSQLSALSSNQSELKTNLSTLVNQLEAISSQV